MKNTISTVKNKISAKLFSGIDKTKDSKSTDVNILLNRVKQNQKKESRKKLLFTAITSLGMLVFGVLIF